jgi:cytochrome P450
VRNVTLRTGRERDDRGRDTTEARETNKMVQNALPPGPRLPPMLQGAGFWNRPLGFLERCRARYGPRFTIRLPLSPPFVMLTAPEDIREVFAAPPDVLRPGAGARVLEPILGRNSVILLDGSEHLRQRKLMLPAFHGEAIGQLSAMVEDVAASEVAEWPDGAATQLHGRLQALTLEIILRAVFGLEPGERMDRLRDALGEMLRFGEKPISLMPPPTGSRAERALARFPVYARFARAQQEADRHIFALLEERRASDTECSDVLAMLLAGGELSDEELRDELMTLLVAGHETTASSLAWGIAVLAREPAVLARLRDELDAGDETYLTATIQETLRRRPVLPNVAPRLVAEEVEIGGWRYPTGVCLVPNAYLVHHDPELYPDPYAFRPERFLDAAPGTYTWIPFGGGRRRCLGASFAMLEMRAVLAALVRHWDIAPAGEERTRRRNITITPGGGCTVRLARRVREPLAAAA